MDNLKPENRMLVCPKCGWFHFSCTKIFAYNETQRFLEYVFTLSPKERKEYYRDKFDKRKKQPDIFPEYLYCFRCSNHYKNFKEPTEEQLQKLGTGHTIGPIIDYKDET